jgi:hypothetical protein
VFIGFPGEVERGMIVGVASGQLIERLDTNNLCSLCVASAYAVLDGDAAAERESEAIREEKLRLEDSFQALAKILADVKSETASAKRRLKKKQGDAEALRELRAEATRWPGECIRCREELRALRLQAWVAHRNENEEERMGTFEAFDVASDRLRALLTDGQRLTALCVEYGWEWEGRNIRDLLSVTKEELEQ